MHFIICFATIEMKVLYAFLAFRFDSRTGVAANVWSLSSLLIYIGHVCHNFHTLTDPHSTLTSALSPC